MFIQKTNPAKEYDIRGYRPIHLSFSQNFRGLALSNDTSYTFIDGNPGDIHNCWYSIGMYVSYNNAIPGPNYKLVDEVDLWARIPLNTKQTCKCRDSKDKLFVIICLILSKKE